MTQDLISNHVAETKASRSDLHCQIAWILCALMWAVLLMQGAAAMQFYAVVPIIALNFIGLVIWFQFYGR